jgi:hypothetical protein
MKMWVVYFNASDFPYAYVARLFVDNLATRNFIHATEYNIIEEIMLNIYGLVKLMPHPNDDKCIVETWV